MSLWEQVTASAVADEFRRLYRSNRSSLTVSHKYKALRKVHQVIQFARGRGCNSCGRTRRWFKLLEVRRRECVTAASETVVPSYVDITEEHYGTMCSIASADVERAKRSSADVRASHSVVDLATGASSGDSSSSESTEAPPARLGIEGSFRVLTEMDAIIDRWPSDHDESSGGEDASDSMPPAPRIPQTLAVEDALRIANRHMSTFMDRMRGTGLSDDRDSDNGITG